MDEHTASLAAKHDITQRLVREGMPGQPVSELAYQHLTRCGQRLQALRRLHGVAGHRIGFGGADAQSASDDRTSVYADVE